MEIDNTVRETLIDNLDKFYDYFINKIKNKDKYDYAFIHYYLVYGIPLYSCTNYFCLKYPLCFICPYGKFHGKCWNASADYYKIHKEKVSIINDLLTIIYMNKLKPIEYSKIDSIVKDYGKVINNKITLILEAKTVEKLMLHYRELLLELTDVLIRNIEDLNINKHIMLRLKQFEKKLTNFYKGEEYKEINKKKGGDKNKFRG